MSRFPQKSVLSAVPPSSADDATIFEPIPDIEGTYRELQQRERARRTRFYGAAGLGLMLILGALFWLVRSSDKQRTNPVAPVATASAPVTGAAPRFISSEGRVVAPPGSRVTLSSETGGTLERVRVVEGDEVERGDVLAVLSGDEDRVSLAEAKSKVAELAADQRLTSAELQRHQQLVASGTEGGAALDHAARDDQAARARLSAAKAGVLKLELRIAKKTIRAPINGVLTSRLIQQGETVAPGAPLFTVVDLTQKQIEAEVDEYDLGRVELGADVVVTAEGYENVSWRGTVVGIPASVTSRRLRPQDAARPSDIRVGLVKVKLVDPTPLKLGQRTELRIGSGLSVPSR